MTVNCPYCGSSKLEKTFNFNESTCTMCGCDFKNLKSGVRVYSEGDWSKLCNSIGNVICEKLGSAATIHTMKAIVKDFANRGPDDSDLLLERLSEVASDLHYDFKAGARDSYAFLAIMEGIESVEGAMRSLSTRSDLDYNIRTEMKKY